MAEIFLREYCEQIERTIEQGRYAEAVVHGKHILKQYPKYVAPYRLMGKAMLEANQDEHAADMFRRVLGADPEDLVAWAGLSEVHNARGELDAAAWHLERAFEVDVGNEIVAEELRRLYGQRDGVEPQRVELTRGALARLYLKGGLLSRAVSEFRDLLAKQPERVDLSVALAEALWRNGQRLEAVAVCQQVLDALPYCLKANLILGEIWTRGGREEGQTYLRRAEALDPENHMAQELFDVASPLPAQEVRITPLEYIPPSEAARPAWMAEIEAVSAERPSALFDVAGALEAQIEIPSWLEEVVGEEAAAPAPPGPAEPPEAPPPEEAVPTPAEEAPEWLVGLREGFAAEEPEVVAEAESPDWLAGLGLAPLSEEEVPERPAEPGAEPPGVAEAPVVPGEDEALEWLAEPGVEPASEAAAPPLPPTELPPDWLADIREQLAEDVEAPEEALTPVAEEAPAPAWLEDEELPSGDEALAWLEELTAGKEEELRAQAQAEAEARMAEIMAWPTPAEPPSVEAPPEEAAPLVVEPFGEPEAPPTAVAPVEEAPPVEEAAPIAEEVPMPAWLEGEELPSGDEALAWLEQLAAGKEEELHAQAQAEAEARMAEIMGRRWPAEPPPAEGAPPEAVAPPIEEAITPPVEEAFGWTAFGEPEAPPEAITAVEAGPEEAVPLPIEEALAPPPPEIPEPAYMEEVELPPVVEFREEVVEPAEKIPAPEIAPPSEEIHWGAELEVLPADEMAPAPVIEEVPGVVEMEISEPPEEAIVPPEVPVVEAPAEPFAAERAHLKEHPRDYEAWLALARALWQAGERQEALEAYARVIRAGKMLESVIADLEEYVVQWPDVSTQRALGDAYMRDGRLQEALDIYRRALERL